MLIYAAKALEDDKPFSEESLDTELDQELELLSLEIERCVSDTVLLYAPVFDDDTLPCPTLEGDGENGLESLCEPHSFDLSIESTVNVSKFIHNARRFKEFIGWLWEELKKAAKTIIRKVNEILMKVFDSTSALHRELDKKRRYLRRLKRTSKMPPSKPLDPSGLLNLHISGNIESKTIIRAIEKDFPEINKIKQAYINHLPKIYEIQTKASEVFSTDSKEEFDRLKSELDKRFCESILKANEDIVKAFDRIKGDELPGGRVIEISAAPNKLERSDEIHAIRVHYLKNEQMSDKDIRTVTVESPDALESLLDAVDQFSEDLQYWQGPVNRLISHYESSIEDIDRMINKRPIGVDDRKEGAQALMRKQHAYFRSRMRAARSSLIQSVSSLTRYQFQVLRACNRYLHKSIEAYQ